ncbi:MAG: YbjN domain-containing protein [Spirochaetaceae bacterium]|jgi:hypothetical protein|nr:YbjN domain-containing protein [Spirochaetaceae bacterium]
MAVNKIEQYLIDMMVSYREIGKNMWLLEDGEHDLEAVAIAYDDPLVVFQVTVMEVPPKKRLELFTKLLELNARDILHGAYALEDNKVILIDTLEYAGMDFTEFRATLDAFGLALTQHYPILSSFRG